MASIPPNLGRVPNSLISMLSRQNISSTRAGLLRTQVQLATGLRILRPSDDPVAASLINVLDRSLETSEQRSRNLTHADSVFGTLDQAMSDLTEQVLEAKTIALSQIGIGSDQETRRTQATVIDSIIDGVFQTLNRDFAGVHLFSGSRTGVAAIERTGSGFRYQGHGDGLFTDLGRAISFPITVGADFAIGALSSRVQGDVDLDPLLTPATFIRDLRGSSGATPELGSLTVTINNGSPVDVQVDLSLAETIGDVTKAIESAIRQADPAALGGAFPGALGFSGEQLRIGSITAGYTITFGDGPAGTTARDLGLDNFTFDAANLVNTSPNSSLNPTLTDRTPLSYMSPATPLAYGDILFKSGGAQGIVTTSPSMTIGELKQAVARLDLGIRIEIDPSGNSLNVLNEVSGRPMSVGESGSLAATTLGLRTLKDTTDPSVFNFGRGVEIAHGEIDPTTGLPDATRNLDFEITLTDGSVFNVDLEPADMTSVGDLIAKINSEAAAAGFGGVFTAQLVTTGNGIELTDTSGGTGSLTVRSLNGFAAQDLGLLDGQFTTGATASLVASDRAKVRVESLLSTLVELRDSLLNNDELGIKFAGKQLDADLERVVQGRAVIGSRAARIESEQRRLEDSDLMDQSIKSSLQDLDFVEASLRFSTLQVQLNAAMQTAATLSQLSLLNFLR